MNQARKSGEIKIPIGTYIDNWKRDMPKKHLDEETFKKAIEAFVVVSTDAVIIDRQKRVFYLAQRSVKPMQGWWVIGGRSFAGETPIESIRRCFERETSVCFPLNRFELIRLNRYFWKDREQKPQNLGYDSLAYTFAVELTQEEIEAAAKGLDPNEYKTRAGLQEFNLKRLRVEGVHPMIIDLYQQLFPPE